MKKLLTALDFEAVTLTIHGLHWLTGYIGKNVIILTLGQHLVLNTIQSVECS